MRYAVGLGLQNPELKILFQSDIQLLRYLEVNKCAFTFSSEMRQIQCTPNEFWCVQCPRPAGPSALDKHQIQSRALVLSYFTSKSKCKFINLIHTRQKNKFICSCLWRIIDKMALRYHLRGYCTPRSVFGLLLHFPQKLQHIGNK